MLILYRNIKELRKSLGLSQQDLADRLGYSDRSSIAKIESGTVDLPQSKIEAFAKALGVKAPDLMGWTEETVPLCAGGRAPEDDPNYSNAIAYTFEQIRANGEKHPLLSDDMQRLDRMLQLFDRLDLIDQERIIERIETLLESDKYRKGEN